jgi:hypothetical protein
MGGWMFRSGMATEMTAAHAALWRKFDELAFDE